MEIFGSLEIHWKEIDLTVVIFLLRKENWTLKSKTLVVGHRAHNLTCNCALFSFRLHFDVYQQYHIKFLCPAWYWDHRCSVGIFADLCDIKKKLRGRQNMWFLNTCSLIGKNYYKPQAICFLLDGQRKRCLESIALVLIYLLLHMRARYLRISAIISLL